MNNGRVVVQGPGSDSCTFNPANLGGTWSSPSPKWATFNNFSNGKPQIEENWEVLGETRAVLWFQESSTDCQGTAGIHRDEKQDQICIFFPQAGQTQGAEFMGAPPGFTDLLLIPAGINSTQEEKGSSCTRGCSDWILGEKNSLQEWSGLGMRLEMFQRSGCDLGGFWGCSRSPSALIILIP